MQQKETYHLPGVKLEIDFSSDHAHSADSDDFRRAIKQKFVQHIIKEGVAFDEPDATTNWKSNGEADTRLESAIDAWIRTGKYQCTKAKDKHAKKIRWVLAGDQQVTILLQTE